MRENQVIKPLFFFFINAYLSMPYTHLYSIDWQYPLNIFRIYMKTKKMLFEVIHNFSITCTLMSVFLNNIYSILYKYLWTMIITHNGWCFKQIRVCKCYTHMEHLYTHIHFRRQYQLNIHQISLNINDTHIYINKDIK